MRTFSIAKIRKLFGIRKQTLSLILITALFMTAAVRINALAESESKEEAPEQLYAQAAVLMDADSGRVLYGKNESEVMPMASTTKIMTCILALEYGNLDDIVEVSAYAESMPKVKLFMRQGEKYRLEDLLYSMMLESHNDSAVAIAEAVGGSVEEFAVMMNQKAKEIGCYDTYFITPNGLDAVVNDTGQIHSTTAADLARIMAYCIMDSPQKERFLEITRTKEYAFTDESGNRNFHCNNHNSFLSMMEREGRTYVVALLACGWPNHKTYKWSDMKKLAEYGMACYEYHDIFEAQEFADIPVVSGIAGEDATPYDKASVTVALEETKENGLPYLLCEEDVVEIKTNLAKELEAPVCAGEKVGQVAYYLNDELVKTYAVVTTGEVAGIDYPWILQYVLHLFVPA